MRIDFTALEGFEWDKGNLEHIGKHKVVYRECEEVFFNEPLKASKDENHSKIEERFEVLGKTNNGRLLFVVYTIRDNQIRVISARSQNRKERREYKQSLRDKSLKQSL